MRKRIEDLVNVETEHLLGAASGFPLVVLRAESAGTVVHAHLTPTQARDIAEHLFEAAARAEYEYDLYTAGKAAGLSDEQIAPIMHMVRSGEMRRHTEVPFS